MAPGRVFSWWLCGMWARGPVPGRDAWAQFFVVSFSSCGAWRAGRVQGPGLSFQGSAFRECGPARGWGRRRAFRLLACSGLRPPSAQPEPAPPAPTPLDGPERSNGALRLPPGASRPRTPKDMRPRPQHFEAPGRPDGLEAARRPRSGPEGQCDGERRCKPEGNRTENTSRGEPADCTSPAGTVGLSPIYMRA